MWKDYFKGILNSESSANGSVESVEHSTECKKNYLGLEMPMCSCVSLASLLQKLPLNKAPGPDCISAEHLLYADESLRYFLSELFNMGVVHGYIPNSCLHTTIVPLCKNKNGNMTDTSNYRPVAVVTVVSKLFEHFILSKILMQIKWSKHFSEPFHVSEPFPMSNGVRQGGVLSPYLFAVYLDDLSNELNNIKAGCYIGEVLLNDLMFADNVCVFCPSVHWLQRILDVWQAYAESHGIIFNLNKTVCMTFKAKSAKSAATPVLKFGGQYVKSVDQYKYLGILFDTELSDDKDIQRQLRY